MSNVSQHSDIPGDDFAATLVDESLVIDRVIHAAATSIVVTNPLIKDNPIIFHNPAFERISGYSAGEIDGRNCRFLQGPDTDPAAVEVIREAIAQGVARHVTLLNYRKDGTPFWNELALSPIRDANGDITHFVGVQNDVTRRVEAERERESLLSDKERLIREKEQIRLALDSRKQELEEVSAKLASLETTDALTGLYDRRVFQERLDEEAHRSAQYGMALSLILLDIDDFKGYNDSFGHPAGDAALVAVARLLEQDIRREYDMVARYGGEEFVVLLPHTDGMGAVAYAERLRATIEKQKTPHRPLTASFGVAALRPSEEWAALIERADAALYQAKAAGRKLCRQRVWDKTTAAALRSPARLLPSIKI